MSDLELFRRKLIRIHRRLTVVKRAYIGLDMESLLWKEAEAMEKELREEEAEAVLDIREEEACNRGWFLCIIADSKKGEGHSIAKGNRKKTVFGRNSLRRVLDFAEACDV